MERVDGTPDSEDTYTHINHMPRTPSDTSMYSVYVSGAAPDTSCTWSERPVELNILLLKKTFLGAEKSGRGLQKDQFVTIMKATIGSDMSSQALETLFTKVDVESLGYLTWLTFLNYFAQEYQEKNRMMTNVTGKPFPHGAQEYESTRRDSIVSVCFMPVYQQGVINYKRGRYVTVTSDGFVNIWNMAIKYVASHAVESTNEHLIPMVVYDMVFVPSLNLVATSTSNRDILFYEISSKNTFAKSYHVVGLEHSAMCMDFCNVNSHTAILMWGDMSGNVFGVEFDMQQAGLFGMAKVNQKDEYVNVKFVDIGKGVYVGTVMYSLMCLHNDWVSKVKYIKENEIFISCCQDPDTCIFLGDLKEKKTCYYFKIKKGSIAIDYCPIYNVIAAGGMDYCIRVWNPYVRSDATLIFRGFTKPVTHVAINGKRGDIIGVDKGNTVRIFSLVEQVLLQVVSSRSVSSSWLPVTAMFVNPQLQLIVLATSRLSVLQKTENLDERLEEQNTHSTPVRCMCYSEAYEEVISACEESVINVWNIITGTRVIQIPNAHTRREMGEQIHVELTAMSLDRTGRRLITAGKNGNVKVWNYSNGATLQSLFVPEASNITGIVNVDDKIYIGGWNKFVGMFVEGSGSEEYKAFKKVHHEEILCMLQLGPNILATAAYDGEIILWALDKMSVICKLHYLVEVDKEKSELRLKAKQRRRSMACSIGIVSVKKSTEIPRKPSAHKGKYDKLPAIIGSHASGAGAGLGNTLQPPSIPTLFPSNIRPSTLKPKSVKKKKSQRSSDTPASEAKPARTERKSFEDNKKSERSTPEGVAPTGAVSRLSFNEFKKVKGAKRFVHGYAIEAMLLLENRPFDKSTANIFTAGAGGWVRAWNIDKRGGHIIGQFNPTRTAGENTCALATDKQNKYLITGDSQGYLAVWDIRSFCISAQSKAKMLDENFTYNFIDEKKFIYLRKSKLCQKLLDTLEEKKRNQSDAFQVHSEFFRETPPLLTVHLGHTRGINSVLYIDKYEVIVTASSDAGVRVWTLYGVYCGTFGHHTWPDIDMFHQRDPAFSRVPSDIKRVASATTLKVLNSGKLTHWGEAILTMKNMGFLDQSREDEEDLILAQTQKPTQILGKFYQSRVRHRMLPTLPKLFELYDAVSVWHTIKYREMEQTKQFRPHLLMGISNDQRTRILANERSVVYTKKVKIRKPKLKKILTSKAKPRLKTVTRIKALETIRENYQVTRAAVERIDVDCRMVGTRQGAEPIVIS